MLVCSVVQRPPRHVLAASIIEVAAAIDAPALRTIFATLTDDPGDARDLLDAFNGQRMVEAANATATFNASIPAVYPVSLIEAASAAAVQDATAGVSYVTWDAATVTSVTLSGGNLVATNTGTTSTNQGARVASASGRTSGKYYFEVVVTTYIGGGSVGVGIGTTGSTYTGMGANATVGVVVYSGSSIYSNGGSSGTSLGISFGSGLRIRVAVDLGTRKIWFAPNTGTWNGSVSNDPVTGVGGVTIPAGTMVPFLTFGGGGGGANNVFTANFGASAFTSAVPSGFTSGWPV